MLYAKPLPRITAANRPFWEGAKARQLVLPRCEVCSSWVYPIAPMCQQCWSENLHWSRLSGTGRLSSWVVFHRAFDPSFAADVPYMVVQVDLDEGMRFISNLVDVRPDEIHAGMRVAVVFDDVTPDITIVRFRRQ